MTVKSLAEPGEVVYRRPDETLWFTLTYALWRARVPCALPQRPNRIPARTNLRNLSCSRRQDRSMAAGRATWVPPSNGFDYTNQPVDRPTDRRADRPAGLAAAMTEVNHWLSVAIQCVCYYVRQTARARICQPVGSAGRSSCNAYRLYISISCGSRSI